MDFSESCGQTAKAESRMMVGRYQEQAIGVIFNNDDEKA